MVRGASTPALENVALWHERDISHSSVERFIGPDATITLDFALARLTERDRQTARLSRADAEEPRPHGRAGPLAARAAGADPGRAQPRGHLCAGPAQRDEGVGIRRRSCRCSTCSRPTPRSPRASAVGRSSRSCSTSTIICKHVDTIFERVFGVAELTWRQSAMRRRGTAERRSTIQIRCRLPARAVARLDRPARVRERRSTSSANRMSP